MRIPIQAKRWPSRRHSGSLGSSSLQHLKLISRGGRSIKPETRQSLARLALDTPSVGLGAHPLIKDRIERNAGRRRKTTIVALARKLLVALRKYVES
jgi:hypothetical protein